MKPNREFDEVGKMEKSPFNPCPAIKKDFGLKSFSKPVKLCMWLSNLLKSLAVQPLI